jgi:hypothetical protein
MEVVPTTCLPRSRACPLARARCTCARTRAEVVHALAQVTESGHKVAAPHSLQRTALVLVDDPGQNPRQLYTQTALDCTRLVYATCNVCVRRNSTVREETVEVKVVSRCHYRRFSLNRKKTVAFGSSSYDSLTNLRMLAHRPILS